MDFRQARLEDMDQVMALRWEFQTSHTPETYDHEGFKKAFESYYQAELHQSLEVFVVDDGHDLHGTVFLTRIRKVPKPQKLFSEIAYVAGVYVRDHLRNQGIGTKLFETVVDWAKSEEIELIHLWPSQLSKSYYQRLGFESDNDIVELDLES